MKDGHDEILHDAEQLFINWQYSEYVYGIYRANGVFDVRDTYLYSVLEDLRLAEARHAVWQQKHKKLREKALYNLGELERCWETPSRFLLCDFVQASRESKVLGALVRGALQTQNWRAAIEYVSSGVLSTTHFALLNTLDKKGLSNVIEEYKCSSCGALHTVSVTPIGTRHRFCPRCVERHTRHSVVQGGRIMRDRSVSFVPSVASWRAGEYDYCTADYAIAERFVRVYMPSAGQDHYVTPALRDELVLHGYIERPKVIGAYHSSKAVVNNFIGNDAAAPFLGMELEVETRSQSDSDAEAKATVLLGKMQSHDFGGKKYTYCNTERDGSLSAGFEIVTAPCTLDVHAEKLKQLATVIEGLQSHPTTTCGLHVHIDRKGTSPLQRGKMVMFINSPKNRTLIEAVARRYNVDHYAKILSKRLTNGTHDSPDRYEAVNLTNRHTIEFRIFKGTLRYESIMACLEFTRAVWFFTRHAGFNDLYEKQFVEWVNRPENRGDTPNLRQVLFEKGLLTGRPPLRETTPAPAGEK